MLHRDGAGRRQRLHVRLSFRMQRGYAVYDRREHGILVSHSPRSQGAVAVWDAVFLSDPQRLGRNKWSRRSRKSIVFQAPWNREHVLYLFPLLLAVAVCGTLVPGSLSFGPPGARVFSTKSEYKQNCIPCTGRLAVND